jgi:hypothetical protein
MKENKKQKTNSLLVFAGVLFVILITSLFCVIILTKPGENKTKKENGAATADFDDNQKTEFAAYFTGCDLLNKECLNANCDKYFLCNDKKYLTCEIYDCQEEFGIGTKDEDGKIDIRRKIKDERKKIAEIKSRCDGTLKILKSDCVEEKLEMQVQVSTAGDCAIEGFMAVYETEEDTSKKSFKPAKFSDLGNGLYLVKTSNCKETSELIAIGEAGVSIK